MVFLNSLPKKRAIHKTKTALLTSSLEVLPQVEPIDNYKLVSSPFRSFREFSGFNPELYAKQEGL